MKRLLLMVAATACLLCACHHNDYTPKPYAYLRIDMPEHDYFLLDTMRFDAPNIHTLDYKTFPFTFEANRHMEWMEKDAPKGERWIDLMYPQWDGVIFLTYKQLHGPDDMRGQIDTSTRLLEQHYQFTSGIEEQRYADNEHQVYGTVYYLKGAKVASTCQFWLTDSVHHFLRGALYLNTTPNNDSLAPVIEYMQTDIEHLVETLRWRGASAKH